MILHGLCPAALIRRPRLFSPSRKLLTKDLVPRVFQDARVFFLSGEEIKKNRPVEAVKDVFPGFA